MRDIGEELSMLRFDTTSYAAPSAHAWTQACACRQAYMWSGLKVAPLLSIIFIEVRLIMRLAALVVTMSPRSLTTQTNVWFYFLIMNLRRPTHM